MLTALCECFILVFIAIDIKAVSYVHVKVNMLKTTTKKTPARPSRLKTIGPLLESYQRQNSKVKTPQMHGCRDFVSEKCLALTKSKLTETQIPRDLSQNSKQASCKNPTNAHSENSRQASCKNPARTPTQHTTRKHLRVALN